MNLIKRLQGFFAVTVFAAASSAALAQSYPTQPIKLVVPYGAGSATDILARRTGAVLSTLLGQGVIVDNKAGGSGAIGASFAARAPADGYTLFFGTTQTQSVNPHLLDTMSYDPLKDFVSVARLYSVGTILVVSSALPVKSIEELMVWLKANPGKANFGSTGFGTASHLPGAYLSKLSGVKITHVPYNNPGQLMTDLTRGEVTMLFYPPEGVKGFIDSGALKPLAWTGDSRSATFPNVPTMRERNFPNFTFGAWYGVFAPTGTPPAIVARLSEALGRVVRDPAVVQGVTGGGAQVDYAPAAELEKFMKTEYERFRQIASMVGKKD
ncbi:MAG: tripartite tricarboxylate transporter substrate binding protein [Burkholderiaceae bacterium]|nr:tripartite tricarboxylate transporter substrate binding protein [Burkholderiaceae bacterium]MDO9090287.1 tripartite tricarboxylate transporter substrate binding protein [Burkholderiaceae bacterium]